MSEIKKLSSKIGASVGVGILSWKSHKTLEKSLQSYEQIGFKEFFDDVKIIFQEVSDKDKLLAQKYGYDYIGTEKNLGIQNGHKLIHENIQTDYILVLENDNPIVEDAQGTFFKLLQALELLENHTIDMMRLRHRWQFGEGFSLEKYLDYFDVQNLHEKYSYDQLDFNDYKSIMKPIKRFFRPDKVSRIAGYSLYFEKEPEDIFPQYIKKLEDDLFIVDSYIMTWTNQSVLLKRNFYGTLLQYAYDHPTKRTANGFQDFEKPLNCKWWRDQGFKIGVGEGIFTHNRFDDSWRKVHHAYNESM